MPYVCWQSVRTPLAPNEVPISGMSRSFITVRTLLSPTLPPCLLILASTVAFGSIAPSLLMPMSMAPTAKGWFAILESRRLVLSPAARAVSARLACS